MDARGSGWLSSRRTEAHADLIRATLVEIPDIILPELKARLAERGPGQRDRALALLPSPPDHAQKRRRTPPSRTGPMC